MRFLIGLGNPGPKYVDTRHNFGFLCLDKLSGLYRDPADWSLVEEFTRTGVARWQRWRGPDSAELVLAWPLTYMNLSGQAFDFLAARYGAPERHEILVAVDDMSLPLGGLRLRKKGSSGGHNGLKSMEGSLGDGDYPRLRLGIGQPASGLEVIDFVLSPFEVDEVPVVAQVVEFAARAMDEWSRGVSFEELVGKVNGWRRQS